MKIQTAAVVGLLAGAGIGLVGLGKVNLPSTGVGTTIHSYAWWIVVVSMLVPLYDYLTGVKTTMLGVVTRHPYRQWAGFFAGLSVGLGLLLLLSSRLPL